MADEELKAEEELMVEELKAEEELKAGDIVTLKSGGPDMTIDWIDRGKPKETYCVWFDGTKNQGDFYRLTSLKKVDMSISLDHKHIAIN